jgi:hypothetical protein
VKLGIIGWRRALVHGADAQRTARACCSGSGIYSTRRRVRSIRRAATAGQGKEAIA